MLPIRTRKVSNELCKMDNDRRKYEKNFWDWTLNIFSFSKEGRNNNAVTWNSTVPTFLVSNHIELSYWTILYYLFHLICFFEIFYPRLTKKSKLILYYHYIKFHFYKPLLKTKEIKKLHFHHVRYLNLISIPFFFISYKII